MKRTRKSNRVSWATGANLCQVKKFLSEDCPSKVGQKSQDHVQAKTSLVLHSSDDESIDIPPGFEGYHLLNQSKVEFSLISQIKWECPPQFILSDHWKVAAGEKSKEKEYQKMRETRLLEAVYPHPSAIPPSPSVYLDVEKEDYDDNPTPLIPLIPVEEVEESMDNLQPSVPSYTPPLDVAASATLPISFLKPPTPDNHTTMSMTTMPSLSHDKPAAIPSFPAAPSISFPSHMPPALNYAQPPQEDTFMAYGVKPAAPLASITFNELSSVPLPSANYFHSVVNQVQSTSSTLPYQLTTCSGHSYQVRDTGSRYASCSSVVKDANYYKNLIRQHGADKHDTQDYSQIGMCHSNSQEWKPVHNKRGEVKRKIQKPCKFFKSSRGCRNGSKCPYQHDNVRGGQNAKILKL